MPMTREEIDEFLAAPRLCHFATIDAHGHPRVRPLWYAWRDGEFWFTTRREVRHTGRDLGASERVAVSIATEDRPYRAVVAHGTPEIVEPTEEMLLSIATRYGDEAGRRWAAKAKKEPDRVMMRMRPDVVLSWNYGREETEGSKQTQI